MFNYARIGFLNKIKLLPLDRPLYSYDLKETSSFLSRWVSASSVFRRGRAAFSCDRSWLVCGTRRLLPECGFFALKIVNNRVRMETGVLHKHPHSWPWQISIMIIISVLHFFLWKMNLLAKRYQYISLWKKSSVAVHISWYQFVLITVRSFGTAFILQKCIYGVNELKGLKWISKTEQRCALRLSVRRWQHRIYSWNRNALMVIDSRWEAHSPSI